MLNRAGLDILVHPLTEDAVEDHSSYAMWLGNPVALKMYTRPRRTAAERGKPVGAGLEGARHRRIAIKL